MIFGKENNLAEQIIKVLDHHPLKGPDLVNQLLLVTGKNITKQAVYSGLRQLIDQEVVTKTGNLYELNRVWLQKLNKFTARHLDVESELNKTILEFSEGDSVTYKFKSPNLMDVTWGHLYDLVYEITDPHQVIINHHPHEWLIHGRQETEEYWLQRYNDDKKLLLFNIGGNTELDKVFKKEYSGDFIKINNGMKYGLRPNQYLAVVGDYIFNISIEYSFEQQVDQVFNDYDGKNFEQTRKTLELLSNSSYSSKLKLSKNSIKAQKWRNQFAKDFHIPRPYFK